MSCLVELTCVLFDFQHTVRLRSHTFISLVSVSKTQNPAVPDMPDLRGFRFHFSTTRLMGMR